METGLTSGWHLSRGGATYGPYEWNDLVAWAQGGRLAPGDLVWQAQLPGWTPAGQVPGLFPAWSGAPAPAYEQARRASSHRGRWALIAGLATLVVAGAVVGVLFATGVFSKHSVVVETPMQGPTVIDVPYDSSELAVSPEDGGQLEFQGAQISVPPGAVASDTTLEVKVLQDDFNVSQTVSPDDELFAVGSVVDFGPAGTTFDQPVTVTVPYDESLLPAGIPEENVALVYWDGSAWVTVQGTVDTNNNTVTAQLREFDGVLLTTVAALTLVPIAVGLWIYILTRSDPIKLNGMVFEWSISGADVGDLTRGEASGTITSSTVRISGKMSAGVTPGASSGSSMSAYIVVAGGTPQEVKWNGELSDAKGLTHEMPFGPR